MKYSLKVLGVFLSVTSV
jgi:hypothetical protein